MPTFVLVRVDDRLIHGQVVTKWVKQTKCNKIVIVDDEISKQEFLANIYSMAAPPGIVVEIKSVTQAVEEWNINNTDNSRILLLFKSIATAKELWEKGISIETLQIGGIGAGPGKKVVYQTVSLSEEDVKNLLAMHKQGVKVEFQTIPEENKVEFVSILNKHFKALLKNES